MPQKKIVLPERGAETLFDLQGENIQSLESLFRVKINARGGELFVEGDKENVAALEGLLDDFSKLVSQGHEFENGELKDAFQQIAEGQAKTLLDFLPRRPVLVTPVRQVAPRSINQLRYVEAIEKVDMVFGIGPAGTGKTYLAMAVAVAYLLKKAVSRIILARPAVEAGEKLGFLPGDLQEKVNPYLRPLYDALFHMVEDQKVEKLIERGVIEIAPLAFMRGRTLSDSFIILDEAQNCTSEQMKMFLTRMGVNSKVVVTGDVTQIDLPRGQVSGLVEAREVLSHVPDISFCYFDERDVVRHRLVKKIIQAYDSRRDF
ncbi:MAG: PhoH family protein [Acidobacteria bacterium]|nr:MAG: PhoH family protein [Acidobacteriota bacterium]RPJ84055.1 MAG: PhoH family protein [Acidobacteriota bacterium]